MILIETPTEEFIEAAIKEAVRAIESDDYPQCTEDKVQEVVQAFLKIPTIDWQCVPTGNSFSIAATEFLVIDPNGIEHKVWSGPWNDYSQVEQLVRALVVSFASYGPDNFVFPEKYKVVENKQ